MPGRRAQSSGGVVVIRFSDAVDGLRDPQSRGASWRRLLAAGDHALPAVTAGLKHPAWSVRLRCAVLLDRASLDDVARDGLIDALRDKNRKVRAHAVHSLGCDACKPGEAHDGGCDVVGLVIDRLLNDVSARVRRSAAVALWRRATEPRIVEALRAAASYDPHERVRFHAGWVLRDHLAR